MSFHGKALTVGWSKVNPDFGLMKRSPMVGGESRDTTDTPGMSICTKTRLKLEYVEPGTRGAVRGVLCSLAAHRVEIPGKGTVLEVDFSPPGFVDRGQASSFFFARGLTSTVTLSTFK